VLVFVVLEKVEDSLLFEKSRDKVQVRFPVLDAEFAQAVLPGECEAVAVTGDITLFEDFGDYVLNVLELENTAILLQRKEPQGRHNVGVVEVVVAVRPERGEFPDNTVEIARSALMIYGKHGFLVDHLVEIHIVLCGQGEVDVIGMGYTLVDGESRYRQ